MTSAEEKILRVEIIGIDGIRRSGNINRLKDGETVELAGFKYRIRDDAIFISVISKLRGLFKKAVPTIVFRENQVEPIPKAARSSDPHPNDVADAVSRTAWALAQLMINKEEKWKTMLLIFAIVAAGAGGASAYFGYENSKAIKDLRVEVEGIVIPLPTQSSINPSATPTTITPTPTSTIPFITGG